MFFETYESLVSTDRDAMNDVYERADGQTMLVSTGPGAGDGYSDPHLMGVSDDGTRAFFETIESLVSADTDEAWDVYERAGGQTTLLSTGPDGGNGASGATVAGASDDGKRVYFQTREVLVTDDSYTSPDVYERADGQTTLVSTGPNAANGAHQADFEGASDDGSHVFLATRESLAGDDADGAWDLYDARTAPEPASPPPPAGSAGGGAAAPAPAACGPAGPLPGACANVKPGSARIDILTGSTFGDRLSGLAGNDVLIGLAGDDCLNGNAGNDRVNGNAGNDTINSRDGRRETVRCGKGTNDRVHADRKDKLIDCERVARVG